MREDVILESLRAIVVGFTLSGLIRGHRSREMRSVEGWHAFLLGFTFIFLGTLIDITDNFPELNRLVVVGDTPVEAFLEKVVGYLLGFLLVAAGVWRWLPKLIEYQQSSSRALESAQHKVKTLHGLLPICASCKKIRDDDGYWNQVEKYVSEHSEAEFSHGICPDCAARLYPNLFPGAVEKEGDE